MRYFRVVNFERHQHYKHRRPAWIKLHGSILTDFEFGELPELTQLHAIKIWILASQMGNRIPMDPQWVGSKIQSSGSKGQSASNVDLELLLSAGFIKLCRGGASTVRANRGLQSRDRVETETETEKIPAASAPVVARTEKPRVTWLTPYWDAWVARYGAEPHAGQLSKYLKRPRDALGDAECVARWGRYLAATDGQFVSPAKFAATHGEYRGTTDLDALIEREKARECG